MTNPILSQSCSSQNYITQENLEDSKIKICQTSAVLYILTKWLSDTPQSAFSRKDISMIEEASSLAMELVDIAGANLIES